jgi:hypothetical protein
MTVRETRPGKARGSVGCGAKEAKRAARKEARRSTPADGTIPPPEEAS